MEGQIKVIQYGLGPIGLLITRYLSERSSIKIIGAIDIDPQKINKNLGDLAGIKNLNLEVTDNIKKIISVEKADAVIVTTSSSLEKIKPQLLELLSFGINVVSTCEELTQPWQTNPAIANEIDKAAKENNVSVLSTGVNPGFLMDFLPLALTAVCKEIKKITIERTQDAQFRRLPFQQKIGAGLTLNEFEKRKSDGTLRHVGLTESIYMIAEKIGWTLTKTDEIIEPIIAERRIFAEKHTIDEGFVSGVHQIGKGFAGKDEVITLIFNASVGQPDPKDRIIIDGTPKLDMIIKDGVNGDIATCAITVNAIPAVVKAKSGLRTMADIETISYWI
jgi:4-hydroxy-tetrahydrodipicolinate reductase